MGQEERERGLSSFPRHPCHSHSLNFQNAVLTWVSFSPGSPTRQVEQMPSYFVALLTTCSGQ